MNREIKFRIWCKGASTNANFNKPCWIQPTDFILLKYYRCFQDVIESDDFVVQQYTGLKDKNGKEIYEGDICNAGMVTGPIEFIIGSFSLASNPLIEFMPKDTCVFSPDFDPSWIDVEVVGNLCENPDYFKNNE